MKKFVFTVASVLALGMAGAGFAQTTQPSNTNTTPANNSAAPSTQAPSTMQQGIQAQTAPANLSEDQLKQVQGQLKTAGLYKGQADGKMGTETKQAVQQFQQQNGLQATGELDQQTMDALQSNHNAGSSASPNGASSPNAGGTNSNPTNQR